MELARLRQGVFYGIGLLAASAFFCAPDAARASTRDPRPFMKPYHDGFVLMLWKQDYSDSNLSAILAKVRATGAEMLEIPVFGCQSTIHSSDVADCPNSNRPFAMKVGKAAVAQGLSVTFLPIVITPQWDWRGTFDPDDVAAWFKNYTAWMDTIAWDSITLGSPELIAGSELKLLYKNTQQWKDLLTHLRGSFPGPLVVTANWDDLDYGFWDEADAIGVSTYFPLSTKKDPAQSILDSSWRSLRTKLLQVSKQWNRPLHFTEIGYTSSTAAAATPWAYTSTDTPDSALQARCFDAFRKTWTGQKALVRASVWGVSDPDAPDNAMSFDPLGKPAEVVLKRLFAERPSAVR